MSIIAASLRRPHHTLRLLVIPGLHDSGPAHWQTWLQSMHRGSLRVQQADWVTPELDRWAERVGHAVVRAGGGPFIAAAHSFGCLALARYLLLEGLEGDADSAVAGALFVAPADPDKFGVAHLLPQGRLEIPSTLVASDTDPWLSAGKAAQMAGRWGSRHVNLGDAGHINAESGFGPLPLAARWVRASALRHARSRRWRYGDTLSGCAAVAEAQPSTLLV